ncbi:MAG: hypothetical protein HKN76_16165 [Saprospiraceae bacterium]|nr:hypothetical protein [Saprospiraceae bacterium]
MVKGIFLIVSAFASATVIFAQHSLPLSMPDVSLSPLRSMIDVQLESRLRKELQANPEWSKMVRQKKLAVGLVDLREPDKARFARINGNEMMYAASLPKIAILLAVMDAFEKGEVEETDTVLEDLHKMICYSNNQASTRMIDLVGYDKIAQVLTDERYRLYDEDNHGGLWVGKRYAASGPRNPDPIKGLSHAATVSQVCRYYYLLAMGQLVSPERSRQMLDILVDPALHHKFVNTLDQVHPDAKIFRKSGSWKVYHCDSVLVWGDDPEHRYILVAMAEHENGEQIIRQMVHVAEKALDIQEVD